MLAGQDWYNLSKKLTVAEFCNDAQVMSRPKEVRQQQPARWMVLIFVGQGANTLGSATRDGTS